MQTLIIALLLVGIFTFFAPSAQAGLRLLLQRRPAAVWAFPFYLTGLFAAAAAAVGALSPALMLTVLAYTAAPVVVQTAGRAGEPPGSARDFLTIALLWLPLEFAAGAGMIPRAAQGFLHAVAYGIAILLALALFTGRRATPGLKFNLPKRVRDLWLSLVAFAVLAPVLAILGIAIGFIPPPHLPVQSPGAMARALALIFLGTALPEEILFRSLIQNLIMHRFGENVRSLIAASVIFGCAHLDNGPQALPNWRYMILATIAGVAYGRVFQKASSVTAPAALHMLVDWTKHFFF